MIAALLLGRKDSQGFPGKNIYPVLGRPLMEYPLLAASNAPSVNAVYVSTDSEVIKKIAIRNNANIIQRPPHLCSNEALGEDAFKHGYEYIKSLKKDIEFMILLFCNAPCFLPEQIEEGIRILRVNTEIDSAVTVSGYNMYSPVRARTIGSDGLLQPFIPFSVYDDSININCDRNSQGDVWFADVCLSVVRVRCLDNLENGILPQKWMGKKIYPIKQWGGLDVDFEYQIPQVEFWLKKHGFTEKKLPYKSKKV
jgi:hypothetical protein